MTDELGRDRVVAQMVPGVIVGGVHAADQVSCYLSFTQRMKDAGRCTHLLARDGVVAERLFRELIEATDGSISIAQFTRCFEDLPRADLIVSSVEVLAVNFLYETLHTEFGEQTTDREVALLHEAREILLEPEGLIAIARTDEVPLIDRIEFGHFIAEYRLVAGTAAYLSDLDGSQIANQLGVPVIPGGSTSRRLRIWPSGSRTSKVASRSKLDDANRPYREVERKQRQRLVQHRNELLVTCDNLNGVQAILLRAAPSPASEVQARTTLVQAVEAQGATAVQTHAADAVRHVIPRLWRRHLAALDQIQDSRPTLSTYADHAHRLFADLLTELDLQVAACVTNWGGAVRPTA